MSDVLGTDSVSIDTGAIVQSKKDVVELGQALDQLRTEVSADLRTPDASRSADEKRLILAIDEMQTRVSTVLSALSRAEGDTAARATSREDAHCPYCNTLE